MKFGDVYEIGDRFAVRDGHKQDGFGDSLFRTREEAEKWGAKAILIREQNNQYRRKRDEEIERAASLERESQHLDGFDSAMPPMRKAKVIAALTEPMMFRGKPVSRRDIVRQLVGEGWEVNVEGNELIGPDNRFIPEKAITRTGIAYALFLISRNG